MDKSPDQKTKLKTFLIEEKDKEQEVWGLLRRMKPWIGQCKCSRRRPPPRRRPGKGERYSRKSRGSPPHY